MPIFEVQGPDGKTYEADAPSMEAAAAAFAPPPKAADPIGFLDQALSKLNSLGKYAGVGMGENALHMASGAVAQPLSGLAGMAAGLAGADAAGTVGKVQNALTYQPKTPEGQDISGAIGAVTGLLPKAGDYLGSNTADATGSPALGAAVNTAVQALPMLAGKILGGADLPAPLKVTQPVAETLKKANALGIRVTPEYAGASGDTLSARLASSGGSETKLQQLMSKINAADAIPKAVKAEIGIDPTTPLTQQAIDAQAAKSNAVYDAVKRVGNLKPDTQLKADIAKIGDRNAAESAQFGTPVDPTISALKNRYAPQTKEIDTTVASTPGMGSLGGASPPKTSVIQDLPLNSEAIVEAVKRLKADSRANFKNDSDPQALHTARAQQQTAAALDDWLQRALKANGQPNLAKAFTDARTNLAKIHTVNDAFNEATGTIDPKAVARDYDNGVPLSGNLHTIAMAYKAFPKVLQAPERLPHTGGGTFGDQLLTGAGLMHGNYAEAAAGLARPVARGLVSRPAFQNQMINPAPPGAMSGMDTAALLQSLAVPPVQQ